MPQKVPAEYEQSPALGGARRERDLRLWASLIGKDDRRRAESVRTIKALSLDGWYAHELLTALSELHRWQLPFAGDALSLLGDPRFSPPYYLSEMLPVPGGRAIVGSREFADEQPVHAVDMMGFALSQMPVTQLAYAKFVQETGHRAPRGWKRGKPHESLLNSPVVWISARDAEAYCRWLSASTGSLYRLPTEAEWILAARGVDSVQRYPCGESLDASHANIYDAAPLARMCAVGLFPDGRGPYGHLDLSGNVWEWCSSLAWRYPYVANDGREDPGSNEPRVMHGGSWRSRPFSARCASRQGEPPGDSFEVVGFRIVRTG